MILEKVAIIQEEYIPAPSEQYMVNRVSVW